MKKMAFPNIRSALAILSAAAILAACAPQPPKSVARSETIEASAIVEAIDYSTREVVLRDAQGRQTLVKAGPEVRNLAQVKKGDRVVVRFTEGFAAQVVKPGTGVTGVQAETSMVRAAPGEQPGATIGEQIKTTVKVYEVDPYANTIEVIGPRGYNRRLKVKDPQGIAFIRGLKKGDEVEVTFSEALAISVEPAK
jgi:Cu/Ag efflux protein CusF